MYEHERCCFPTNWSYRWMDSLISSLFEPSSDLVVSDGILDAIR